MVLRPIARWLALAASLIAAALPPAAIARTVCTETGRAAIAWTGQGECALAASEDPPPCCDHDAPGSDTPGSDTPGSDTPGSDTPGNDDCCQDAPALTPTAPPDAGDDSTQDLAPAAWAPALDTLRTPPPPLLVRAPCATGPPDHAARRHLRARRVDVLTV